MLRTDIAVAAAGIALAGLYWWGADAIPTSPLSGTVGAAGLPKILAWALGILCALLALRSLVASPQGASAGLAPAADRDEPAKGEDPWRAHLRAVGMLAFRVVYLAVIEWLGYALSVLLLFAGVALYNGARPCWRLAALSAGIAVVFYFLFVRFLSIPLPAGVWPDLLGR